jgi:glucose/arabinose dehydrogenase
MRQVLLILTAILAGGAGDWRDDAPGVVHRYAADAMPRSDQGASARHSPSVVAPPEGMLPLVPAGFAVRRFARLEGPRIVRVAPNGDVFVAESRAGRIRVLPPDGGEGQVFAQGLDRPFGLAFWPPGPAPRYLYVASNNRVERYAYHAGDRVARGAAEVVVPRLSPTSSHHWTRDVAFSPDGRVMYVSIGSGSNVAEGMERKSPTGIAATEARLGMGAAWGDEESRAVVLGFDPDGRRRQVFATGIRNCVGLAVQQGSGAVWCAVNERDGLGDDVPPDYVSRIREGGFYGWPWFYIGEHEDPRHRGERPDLAAKVTVPDVLIASHSAALGIAFYDGAGMAAFPAGYRGDAFVALHGSWNRATPTGYKLVRVHLRDGVPAGGYTDFMTGFVLDDGRVWGRPVGVAVAKDGALLVSEDGRGAIWRIAPAGR